MILVVSYMFKFNFSDVEKYVFSYVTLVKGGSNYRSIIILYREFFNLVIDVFMSMFWYILKFRKERVVFVYIVNVRGRKRKGKVVFFF